jgi:hypothetical protein
MAAESVASTYLVETDVPFGEMANATANAIKRVIVGKDKHELQQQVQGLKRQKDKLLEIVDRFAQDVDNTMTEVNEIRRTKGNMQFDQDYEMALQDAEKQRKHVQELKVEAEMQNTKLTKAFQRLWTACNELLMASGSNITQGLKNSVSKILLDTSKIVHYEDDTSGARRRV